MSSLDEILLIAAVVAFCGSIIGFVLIRQRDFVEIDWTRHSRLRSVVLAGSTT